MSMQMSEKERNVSNYENETKETQYYSRAFAARVDRRCLKSEKRERARERRSDEKRKVMIDKKGRTMIYTVPACGRSDALHSSTGTTAVLRAASTLSLQ